jgi:hypothetical protein
VHFKYLRINFVRQRYKCECGRNLLQPLADHFEGHSITKRAALQITADCLIHSYEFTALTLFPDVVIVIDPYHVLRLLNEAVSNIVRMEQSDLSKIDRKGLMQGGNRFLLLKRRAELTEAEKEQLNAWYQKIPEFKKAFDLKEEVYDIWRMKDRAEAERRYDEWLKKVPREFDFAFRKFTGSVRRWRKYVFNYFDFRVSNAYTESKNRDIKSLQRQGRRTSFPVLRARLLYAGFFMRSRSPFRKSRPSETKEILKKSRKGRKHARERDPDSYVARIEAARKGNNEFSRLLRPPQGWDDRFSQYSSCSDAPSPNKWDFTW